MPTNQASISGDWELPFGRRASGIDKRLIDGWQLNGIATLLSGFPFTPQIGSNRSGDGDTSNPDRPSLNPAFSGPVYLSNPNQWFNPNAFVLPTAGTYGNVGRSILTGPGLADLDVSLFKTFALAERVEAAVSRGVLQSTQPCEFRYTKRSRILKRSDQSHGGPDHRYGDNIPTDSVWRQIGFLTAGFGAPLPASLPKI